MPRTSNRLNRISDQLKQELARLIQNELRDPRLGLVSVMEVRVSRDLAHAEVFITVLNADPQAAVATLNNAGGLLRSLLAKNLNLRVTPRLKFVFDESVERGRHLSSLIDQALAQDARHATDGEPAPHITTAKEEISTVDETISTPADTITTVKDNIVTPRDSIVTPGDKASVPADDAAAFPDAAIDSDPTNTGKP